MVPVEASSIYALHGIKFLQEIIEDVRNQINEDLLLLGVLVTMFDHRTNISKALRTEIVRYFGKEYVFEHVIHRNTAIEQAALNKQSIFDHSPRAAGARDYLDVAKEVIRRIETRRDAREGPS